MHWIHIVYDFSTAIIQSWHDLSGMVPASLLQPLPALASTRNCKAHVRLPLVHAPLPSSATTLQRPASLPELRPLRSSGSDAQPLPAPVPAAFVPLPQGYVPLSKRCNIVANVYGWADSKSSRKPLEQVLRQMRKPTEEQEGLQKGPWLASIERVRAAESRRRGGVDMRPVPSWNFRYGSGMVAASDMPPPVGSRCLERCGSVNAARLSAVTSEVGTPTEHAQTEAALPKNIRSQKRKVCTLQVQNRRRIREPEGDNKADALHEAKVAAVAAVAHIINKVLSRCTAGEATCR